MPSRFRDGHAAHRANFGANAKVRGMGTGLDLSAITKDGKEIPIEVSLSPIQTVDGTLVAAAIRDISIRKKIEEELRLAKQEAEEATRLHNVLHKDRVIDMCKHAPQDVVMLLLQEAAVV